MIQQTPRFSHKNEWPIDKCNNLGESPTNYAKWKNANLKKLHTLGFHVYNILEMKTFIEIENRLVVAWVSGVWWGGGGKWVWL